MPGSRRQPARCCKEGGYARLVWARVDTCCVLKSHPRQQWRAECSAMAAEVPATGRSRRGTVCKLQRAVTPGPAPRPARLDARPWDPAAWLSGAACRWAGRGTCSDSVTACCSHQGPPRSPLPPTPSRLASPHLPSCSLQRLGPNSLLSLGGRLGQRIHL